MGRFLRHCIAALIGILFVAQVAAVVVTAAEPPSEQTLPKTLESGHYYVDVATIFKDDDCQITQLTILTRPNCRVQITGTEAGGGGVSMSAVTRSGDLAVTKATILVDRIGRPPNAMLKFLLSASSGGGHSVMTSSGTTAEEQKIADLLAVPLDSGAYACATTPLAVRFKGRSYRLQVTEPAK